MTQIIDRRLNGKNKSAVNRQRFLRRFREQIRKSVSDAISQRSIKDIDKGETVNIPTRDTNEPIFSHGPGGRREIVQPGNTDFVTGDKVPRPPAGGGAGQGKGKASNTGEGDDDFVFQLSREEFLEFFFEDLALPDLVKTQLATISEHKLVRAGYTTSGVPTNINVIRSMKGALARRMALRAPHQERLRKTEAEYEELKQVYEENHPKLLELEEEIRRLKTRISAVPFIDTFDLRYNNRIREPSPTTRAVMFCLMDVSGSMNEERKDIAKRFFILLYLFLTRTYKNIDVVFIRHHTTAKEVDEQEFFYSRETGGTVVSSALELMHEIITERYPTSQWNIYAAQASDGDNWEGDSPACREILVNKIMPCLQYYAYVEITAYEHQSLWREYEKVQEVYGNFAIQDIAGLTSIYPVFRELFKKHAA
ncbi:MAG: YeaH/YhbH family protein [Gammaproteobacteria bacterium]|nr:YeaH/YhbH family protein [Gammaproteobacteria bacterium]